MKGSATRRAESKDARRPAASRGADGGTVAGRKDEDGLLEWAKSLAVAVLLFLVIRTFLVQAFTIPSGSMEETLLIGDYLMANNAVFGAKIPFTNAHVPAFREPQHGDVVVFRPSYNEPVIDVVKRVIGEPGDTIQMVDRVVHRNGEPLDEPYVEQSYTPDQPLPRFGMGGFDWHLGALAEEGLREAYSPTRDSWGPLVVPEGHYLLLGDNRDESLDSRYMGFIPREVIRGKAMFIYFSKMPNAGLGSIRWSRVGDVIR